MVSAMGHTTDQLIELAKGVTPDPSAREMDMLLTVRGANHDGTDGDGDPRSGRRGHQPDGSQAGILTDGSHGSARIKEIRGDRVRQGLDAGKVVIVAGFQGVDPDLEGGHHHRKGRLRCHGRRPGRGSGRRRLRDLHRCGRGLHLRPADRAGCEKTRRGFLRRDAGIVRIRRRRPDDPIGRSRPPIQHTDTRPIVFQPAVRERGSRRPRWSKPSSGGSPTIGPRPR